MEILSRSGRDAGHPEHPLVVAFFTEDTPYQGEAEVLKLSLESLGYSYLVCGIANRGTWQKNTQAKAPFIQLMLEEHPGQPLLYLDVDSVMVQPPLLLDDLDADIAAVHFAGRTELLSGTVWFGNTVQCRRVVEKWIRLNLQYPEKLPNGKPAWDQRTLEMAINRIGGMRFVELPQEYTWITELTQRHAPGLAPVILHTRGAKRFKNAVNGKRGFAR